MKKIISLLLAVAMLQTFASGYSANASMSRKTDIADATDIGTEQSDEAISISELGTYTIVYPSIYTELRMDIVYLLQNTIAKVTGLTPEIIPDTEPQREHEIILASSSRQTSFGEVVAEFESSMNYILAAKDSDIILGGQNYWSDLRAVYDFVGNYLGYDDIKNEYNAAADVISGVKTVKHQKPALYIQAATWATVFETAEQIKDVADANFNTIMYTVSTGDPQKLHFAIGQCVRFELYLVINRGAIMTELYTDCPLILGHNLWDEPEMHEFSKVNQICAEYKEKYSKYGWKAWANHVGGYREWTYMSEVWHYADIDVTGFDLYPWVEVEASRNRPVLFSYEKAREITQLHNIDFWTYIQSYNHIDRPTLNTSKDYRWQMYYSMCFGVDGLIYFIYANEFEVIPWADTSSFVVSRGFIKNKQYYHAMEANKDVATVAELYGNYEQVGVYTVNRPEENEWIYLESPYDFSYVIEDIKGYGVDDTYLVGCFDKKEGSGNAFIFMDINEPDDVDYDKTEIGYTKIKINGNKITEYLKGEARVLTPDADGYYSVSSGNGICVFITVE